MFSQNPSRLAEFQAVILAGHGSALFPLTGKDNLCKALLPIGNEPMISAVLSWVEQAGILDVLILTPATYHPALSHHLQSLRQSQTPDGAGAMRIDLVAVDAAFPSGGAGVGGIGESTGLGGAAAGEGGEGATQANGGGGEGSDSGSEDEDEEGAVVRRQTANLLRQHKDLISTDFILLPCDFVPPPSLALADLLDAHRSRPNATVTSLFYERAELGKDGPERILVGYEPGPPTTAATLPVAAPAAAGASNGEGTRSRRKGDRGGTLLFVRELEDTEDDVVVRLSMLRKFPKVTLTKGLLDSHVYIFKHSVLDLLAAYPQIESVREELVPWLVKGGYQTRLAKKWAPSLNPAKDPQALAFQHSTSHLPPSVSCPSTIDPAELAAVPSASSAATAAGTAATGNGGPSSGTGAGGALSESMDDLRLSPASRRRDDDEDDEDADEDAIGGGDGRERWKVSCGLVIHRLDDGFVARANHIPTYFELNRQFLKAHAIAAQAQSATPPATPGLIDPKAQVSTDSIVGFSTKVGERTNVKKSVVGRHCVIGRNVRINGCVIMDFVVVGDGAKIENCILAQRCVVGEKATLTDCEVGGQFKVAAESKVKGEKLADLS